ncbi:MAG: nucleoside triphosphate pyrophosphohydrolase family protein [Nanoarchaeota archaeon]|nr:nucleoside triphosphate pyrophosphohydrolase family protein [Nanoarchaeota archaeon]
MNKQLELVKDFHKKFNVPILETPRAEIGDRAQLRFNLIKEEVDEYIKGVEDNDPENIAKELCDILYCVYGTILEHGLQDVIDEIFEEVHKSQMSKTYSSQKMIKGDEYKEANISKFFKN